MEKENLNEVKEIKEILSKLLGTSHLPKEEKFSQKAIDRVAKEFEKLSIERGEWIDERTFDKYIKNAPYRAGKFIREEFQFSNFFKRGSHDYYYNKKDIIALATELKEKGVDLKRYMELKEDRDKFLKYIEGVYKPKPEEPKAKKAYKKV